MPKQRYQILVQAIQAFQSIKNRPKAEFDENVLHIGAGVYANSAIEWLRNNK